MGGGAYRDGSLRSLSIASRMARVVSSALARLTLVYQGERRFLRREPIAAGAPQISARFSKQKTGEPPKLFVPLNFDGGDPVVFTRVR